MACRSTSGASAFVPQGTARALPVEETHQRTGKVTVHVAVFFRSDIANASRQSFFAVKIKMENFKNIDKKTL
jgi:hypothetical protein